MKRAKGSTIRSDGREIIRNLINVCEEEQRRKELVIDLHRTLDRVALYGNVSRSTVVRLNYFTSAFYQGQIYE